MVSSWPGSVNRLTPELSCERSVHHAVTCLHLHVPSSHTTSFDDVPNIGVVVARLVAEDTSTMVIPDFHGSRVDPTDGYRRAAARAPRRFVVVGVSGEHVSTAGDLTIARQDRDLRAEVRRRTTITLEYNDMPATVW
jgi:hypothetical protein